MVTQRGRQLARPERRRATTCRPTAAARRRPSGLKASEETASAAGTFRATLGRSASTSTSEASGVSAAEGPSNPAPSLTHRVKTATSSSFSGGCLYGIRIGAPRRIDVIR